MAGGRYLLKRVLARALLADLWDAEHVELAHACTVKMLRRPFTVDPRLSKALLNEGRSLAAQRHPHLVTVLDSGHDPVDGAFVVYEALAGEALTDRILRVGALAVESALNFIEQLLGALAAVHASGFAHRNVTPDGLLLARALNGTESLKLFDLGFAQRIDDTPSSTTEVSPFAVSIPYIALEQLRNPDAGDTRADVYAAAAVAYTMLTGAPPHASLKLLARLKAGENLAAPSVRAARPEVPGWLDGLLSRALSARPLVRPASAEEFLQRVRAGRRSSISRTGSINEQALDHQDTNPGGAEPATTPGAADLSTTPGPLDAAASLDLDISFEGARESSALPPPLPLPPAPSPNRPSVVAPPPKSSAPVEKVEVSEPEALVAKVGDTIPIELADLSEAASEPTDEIRSPLPRPESASRSSSPRSPARAAFVMLVVALVAGGTFAAYSYFSRSDPLPPALPPPANAARVEAMTVNDAAVLNDASPPVDLALAPESPTVTNSDPMTVHTLAPPTQPPARKRRPVRAAPPVRATPPVRDAPPRPVKNKKNFPLFDGSAL